MGLFGQGQFGLAALENDRSISHREEACDQPQQRGFTCAIGPGDGQRLAGGGLEIETGKHLPAAPHASDTTPSEPHFASSQPFGIGGYHSRIYGYRIAAARLFVWRCHWNDSISRNSTQHTIHSCRPTGHATQTVF